MSLSDSSINDTDLGHAFGRKKGGFFHQTVIVYDVERKKILISPDGCCAFWKGLVRGLATPNEEEEAVVEKCH